MTEVSSVPTSSNQLQPGSEVSSVPSNSNQLQPRSIFSNQPHGTPVVIECPPITWANGGGLSIPGATLNGNFVVTAKPYYDKNENSDIDFQWILINQYFSVNSPGLVRKDHEGKGWAIVRVDIKHCAPQELIYDQSSPGNVNGETAYSTSWSFNVGAFGTTPTGGASVSGSESHAIKDWQTVFNQKDAHNLSWCFAQAEPFDGTLEPKEWREKWLRIGNGFAVESPHLKVRDFSAISANGVSGSASSTWKTEKVLTSNLNFTFEMDVLCVFLAEHTTFVDVLLSQPPFGIWGNIRHATDHLAYNDDGSFIEVRSQAFGPGTLMGVWSKKQSVSCSLPVDLSRVVRDDGLLGVVNRSDIY